MVSNTLVSPGVSVTVSTNKESTIVSPTSIPLIFIATRANKQAPDGSGTALGTIESNNLQTFTSQTELLNAYGNPVFVTSDGLPVQGDETNEYGLITAYTACGITGTVMIVRADIDLGQLVPTTVEPVLTAPDGTYWIDSDAVIGGIFTFNGSTWSAVNFDVYTTAPTNADGADGDWGFDYSTLNGTIVFKDAGAWFPATTANLTSLAGATDPLYVQSTTPVGAVAGDFWYKTTSSGGGTNLALTKYRASDGVWVTQPITRQNTAPAPVQNTIWEDTSGIATTGFRPLNVGTGAEFITLPVFVQATAPTEAPAEGTLWYDDTYTDFAMYVENGNIWVPIVTTLVSNPSSTEKVISASPPQFPQQDAIWIDVSSNLNIDNFPVVMRWSGTEWEDITSTIYIRSEDPVASLVLDGSYWVNTGESITRFLVKKYDSTFKGLTVDNTGATVFETVNGDFNHWAPQNGDDRAALFGRLSQRELVVSALKEVITANQEIRSENNYYQLIACPFYPETYGDISTLNEDIGQISFALFDVPKFVIPSGIAVGREITISDWATDTRNVAETGEQGFIGAPDPFQATWYPGGLATNPTDGNTVYVPPTYIALRTIAYSDSVSYPWYPPAGSTRGLVTNVSSVGYISDLGDYVPVQMNRPQRDICYNNKINPIANIPHVGLVVYGQKTQSVPGILDRINVVRLICKMKYDFQRLMEPFLFELNNTTTRRSATIVAERYLAGLVSLNALYDYAVLCDSSNNTGAVIAAHQMIVDVAIKPQLSIEFIYVPILVLEPDDEFTF
jgi:hypothetical protein